MVAHVVHGALRYYDLPRLAETLGGKLTIEQPVNAMGVVMTPDAMSDEGLFSHPLRLTSWRNP